METKTLTSSAIWYHISSAKGDSSSRWAKGAARKGIYNGQNSLSLIMFDAKSLRSAIGGNFLQEADLVISRDSAYGTDPVTVCMAPARVTSMGETYMSRSECIGLAKRNMHKCHVLEGNTATFHIPGATLREMWLGEVNAFLLYQELDGSDSYCKFGESAELQMKVGSGLATPVWTRTISAGDTICSEIYSHYADLREIEYYINLRNQNYSQAGTISEMPALQAYGDWTTYITAMRTSAATFLAAEQRTYDWAPLPTGKSAWDSPKAEVVENLKGVFIPIGQGERYTASGFEARQRLLTKALPFRKNLTMNWSQPSNVHAGVVKKWTSDTEAVWDHYVCGWIFDWEQTEITDAELELTVKAADKAKPHIVLMAIQAQTVPDSKNYSEVFVETIVGEGDCGTGTTATIPINQSGIDMLNNGEAYGVGAIYSNDYVEIIGNATLIINQGE